MWLRMDEYVSENSNFPDIRHQTLKCLSLSVKIVFHIIIIYIFFMLKYEKRWNFACLTFNWQNIKLHAKSISLAEERFAIQCDSVN